MRRAAGGRLLDPSRRAVQGPGGGGLSCSQPRGRRACIQGPRGCWAASEAEAWYHRLGDPAGHTQRAWSLGSPLASPEAPDHLHTSPLRWAPRSGVPRPAGAGGMPSSERHSVPGVIALRRCSGRLGLSGVRLAAAAASRQDRGRPHRVGLITSAAQGLYLNPRLLGPMT